MADHQHDPNANELWLVLPGRDRVGARPPSPTYRREMKGIDWGALYNEFKDAVLDTDEAGGGDRGR